MLTNKLLKEFAVQLRNRLSPSNVFRVDRTATFISTANILRTKIDIQGRSQVILEAGARIRDAEFLVRGNDNRLWIHKRAKFTGRVELYGNGNKVMIGERTQINGALLVAHNGRKIEIGSGCLFSYGIELRTTDSHRIFSEEGLWINEDRDICVEDDVWLGVGVLVLKGVRIGRGTVVGARSVVTRGLLPRTLAVGSPARAVRNNISWQK